MADDPDREMLEAVRDGAPRSASGYVARYGQMLHRVAFRMLGDSAEAEDVAQETLLRGLDRLADWQFGNAKFSTWLCQVALNQCRDRIRKRRFKLVDLDAAGPFADQAARPEDALEQAEQSAALAHALWQLPERQREAICLVHDLGLSGGEAAETMGVGVRALESLLARGRRGLRAILLEDKEEVAE